MVWGVSPAFSENAHIQTWWLWEKTRKGQLQKGPLGSYSVNGEFFNKGFGLTMTLRASFCKQVTTTTNHSVLRLYAQETGRHMSRISLTHQLQWTTKGSGPVFENDGQICLTAVTQMFGDAINH